MNTTTKLSAKTLIQLLAIAMITLTLFSCGGGGGGDDTTTPTADDTTGGGTAPATDTTGGGTAPATDTTGGGTAPATDTTGDDTTTSVATTTVSMLSALATGTPSQVNIYWSEVAEATSYKLYKSTTTLSNYQNASPANLSTSSTVTVTTHTISASTITLSSTQTVYFLVTAIKDEIESSTNATQTAATAFTTPFLTVVSTGTGVDGNRVITGKVWMDRNLGATQAATGSTDELAYGDFYQWGRSADGHQIRDSASTDTIAGSITPTHGQFIKSASDWTTADSSSILRSANWAKTDGSSICPTGFRVPTQSELTAELESWSTAGSAGAFASNLKWPVTGQRTSVDAVLESRGITGYFWSINTSNTGSNILNISPGIGFISEGADRARGYPVRCIKD